jgi:hypothetical protein
MAYRVLSAPNTPFEGLVNKVTVNPVGDKNNRCAVEFTADLESKDEKSKAQMEKILQDTYDGILNGTGSLKESTL